MQNKLRQWTHVTDLRLKFSFLAETIKVAQLVCIEKLLKAILGMLEVLWDCGPGSLPDINHDLKKVWHFNFEGAYCWWSNKKSSMTNSVRTPKNYSFGWRVKKIVRRLCLYTPALRNVIEESGFLEVSTATFLISFGKGYAMIYNINLFKIFFNMCNQIRRKDIVHREYYTL